jgi:hypothetical protein
LPYGRLDEYCFLLCDKCCTFCIDLPLPVNSAIFLFSWTLTKVQCTMIKGELTLVLRTIDFKWHLLNVWACTTQNQSVTYYTFRY